NSYGQHRKESIVLSSTPLIAPTLPLLEASAPVRLGSVNDHVHSPFPMSLMQLMGIPAAVTRRNHVQKEGLPGRNPSLTLITANILVSLNPNSRLPLFQPTYLEA